MFVFSKKKNFLPFVYLCIFLYSLSLIKQIYSVHVYVSHFRFFPLNLCIIYFKKAKCPVTFLNELIW